MTEWSGKRYWIIGASAGLGAALAHQLSRVGVSLVLSARSEDDLDELAEKLPGRSEVQPLDVTDPDAIARVASDIGEIDGVVFLAGVYWPFGADEWDAEKANLMAEVNYVGAMKTMGVVVPKLLEQGHGHIVLTGSLSGFRGLPGAIGYGASKAGLMSLAESMHADLRGTGVEVQLINPGFVKTRLTDKNDFNMPFLMEADAAAQEYVEHMHSGGFKKNFPRAFGTMFQASQLLPDWAYYRMFAKSS